MIILTNKIDTVAMRASFEMMENKRVSVVGVVDGGVVDSVVWQNAGGTRAARTTSTSIAVAGGTAPLLWELSAGSSFFLRISDCAIVICYLPTCAKRLRALNTVHMIGHMLAWFETERVLGW